MSERLFHLGVNAAVHAAIVAVAVLSLCGCPAGRDAPSPEVPLRLEGMPTIRVLVASGPGIRVATTGPYAIFADGREVVSSMDPLPEGILSRNGNLWTLHAAGYTARSVTIAAPSGGSPAGGRSWPVRVGSTAYRGSVAFQPNPGGPRGILAVNHVDLESYLAGVLPRELYALWHIRAYQALAVAARTYALYEANHAGGRLYDLRDDQSSQVYGGFSAETDKAWRAVRSTHGLVLAAGEQGRERVFRSHYSACCGGTVNSVYVLYGPPVTQGPLAGGQACTECKKCPRFRWAPVTVPKSVIHRALGRQYPQAAALSGVERIEVVEELHGRPVWIDAVAPDGRKVRVRAEDLRLSLLRHGDGAARGLYSMNCRIRDDGESIVFDQGSGFGHGVGLCQWGTEAKARRGLTYQQILADYYPTAKLFRAY